MWWWMLLLCFLVAVELFKPLKQRALLHYSTVIIHRLLGACLFKAKRQICILSALVSVLRLMMMGCWDLEVRVNLLWLAFLVLDVFLLLVEMVTSEGLIVYISVLTAVLLI